MFSALKFVAAAAIVALFGGFLLASILTTQQDGEVHPAAMTESPPPMTNDEILPGVTLDVEEVEPGVFRVVNDGVRDLVSVEAVDIVTGYDDGIWLLREDEFLRLGSDVPHQWPDVSLTDPDDPPAGHILEVAPDGTMWVIPRWPLGQFDRPGGNLDLRLAPGLRSTDGEEWTVEPCPEGRQYPACRGFTVAPDGKVWAWWDEDGRGRVGHLGPAGWQPLEGVTPILFRGLFLTDAEDVYGLRNELDPLFHYEDGAWERFCDALWCDVGRDGTGWEYRGSDDGVGVLARSTDGRWAEFTLADTDFSHSVDQQFRVAADGSLWLSRWRTSEGESSVDWETEDYMAALEDGRWVCDGLTRFDGESLDHVLPDTCVPSIDVARDGSVWALAADEMPWVVDRTESQGWAPWWVLADDATWDLYVITPEAVAASE